MRRITISISCFVLLVISGRASAQFGGAIWEVLTSDSMQHTLSQKPICATPAGIHLTYSKSKGSGNGWTIYYRFFDPLGGWGEQVTVESTLPSYAPSISAREFGAFRIGIFFDANGDIYGGLVNSPWDPWNPVNLTNSPDPDINATSSIDLIGTAHLSWVTDTNNEYKIAYGRLVDSVFEMEVLVNSDLGDFGSGAAPFIVTVDSLPHIFYRGVNAGFYHIHHAFKDDPDSAWEYEYIFTPNTDDYTPSAVVDPEGDIHLSISGNSGWGMPGAIFYRRQSHQTGEWSPPELVTGGYSAVDGHIGITENNTVYVASAGVSGNIYTGDIYLSNNSSGSFQTEFLTHYENGVTPALTFLPGSVGALVMQGQIDYPGYDNIEIIYYGPAQTGLADDRPIPVNHFISGNYPNPFNSATTIFINSPGDRNSTLGIYDILGRKITELRRDKYYGEKMTFRWDGRSMRGEHCPSGTYFYLWGNEDVAVKGRISYLK